MSSIKIMEAEQAINEYLEVLQQVYTQIGYEQSAIQNWMAIAEVAKTTFVARVSINEQVNELLSRLGIQQNGEVA